MKHICSILLVAALLAVTALPGQPADADTTAHLATAVEIVDQAWSPAPALTDGAGVPATVYDQASPSLYEFYKAPEGAATVHAPSRWLSAGGRIQDMPADLLPTTKAPDDLPPTVGYGSGGLVRSRR